MIGYVYLTRNKINGKLYVGSHATPYFDKKYIGSGVVLLKAVKKHGKKNFVCRILFKADDHEDLKNIETYFINKLKKKHRRNVYNVALDAKRPMLGRKHPEEWKRKRSVATSGINNPMYGVKLDGEKNSRYGHVMTDLEKKNISKGIINAVAERKKKGILHGNAGKIRSAETRKKSSDSKRGQNVTQDLIGNICTEYKKVYSDMPSCIKNMLNDYRGGIWQKNKTIEKNIIRFCDYIGCGDKKDLLIQNYTPNRKYYGVSRLESR